MNTHEAFLARRRSGIGGSDIAAVLGLSPYKTPYQLWLDKTGRADDEAPDADREERMHWGNVLEQVVAQEYATRTGRRVQRINDMLRHPRYPTAVANIDRAVVADGSRARWDDASGRVLGAEGVLECKTAHAMAAHGADWGEPGTDEVPMHYWTQCQWYLGVTGLPHADLAVLFGGQRFATYRIQADAGMQDDLLRQAHEWWNRHVVHDTPPDPTSEADARALWRSHRDGIEKIVGPDVAQAVAELRDVKLQVKQLDTREQELRDVICSAFGDAEAITHGGLALATWRANKPSPRTDWKALAQHLNPQPDTLDQFTTTAEGARVLRLIASKEATK